MPLPSAGCSEFRNSRASAQTGFCVQHTGVVAGAVFTVFFIFCCDFQSAVAHCDLLGVPEAALADIVMVVVPIFFCGPFGRIELFAVKSILKRQLKFVKINFWAPCNANAIADGNEIPHAHKQREEKGK